MIYTPNINFVGWKCLIQNIEKRICFYACSSRCMEQVTLTHSQHQKCRRFQKRTENSLFQANLRLMALLIFFSAVLVHRFPAWLYDTICTLLMLLLILPFSSNSNLFNFALTLTKSFSACISS